MGKTDEGWDEDEALKTVKVVLRVLVGMLVMAGAVYSYGYLGVNGLCAAIFAFLGLITTLDGLDY